MAKQEKKINNSSPEEVLKFLYLNYGEEAFCDSMKLYNMFSDYYNKDIKIQRIIKVAISENIPSRLIAAKKRSENERAIEIKIIKQNFREHNSLEESMAHYIIESFAYAVGIIDKLLTIEEINRIKQEEDENERRKRETEQKALEIEKEKLQKEQERIKKEQEKLRVAKKKQNDPKKKRVLMIAGILVVLLAGSFFAYSYLLPFGKENDQLPAKPALTETEANTTPPTPATGNDTAKKTATTTKTKENTSEKTATKPEPETQTSDTPKDSEPAFRLETENATPVQPAVNTTSVQTKKYDNGTYTGYLNSSGQRHGQGVFESNNGNKYDGNWKNNYMSGFGKYYSVEGWRYEGNFENDKFHGKGKYFNKKNKLIREGIWENGNPVD